MSKIMDDWLRKMNKYASRERNSDDSSVDISSASGGDNVGTDNYTFPSPSTQKHVLEPFLTFLRDLNRAEVR